MAPDPSFPDVGYKTLAVASVPTLTKGYFKATHLYTSVNCLTPLTTLYCESQKIATKYFYAVFSSFFSGEAINFLGSRFWWAGLVLGFAVRRGKAAIWLAE